MSTESRENQGQNSSLWWGLIIGAVAAGLAVYFLDKDKEEKENLLRNLKSDWEGVSEKIKEFVGEKKESKPEKTLEVKSILEPISTTNSTSVKVTRKPVKKFFKKSGRKLH